MRDTYPILGIQIIGVNEVGHEVANDLMTANRSTPWLQDVDDNANHFSDVWSDSWNVSYRDVIIVDGQNETVEVYNLTSNDLGIATKYATLREKLIDAAMTEQKPWQNHRDRLDINDDGFVAPIDVLIMVNEINANGPLRLPAPTGTSLEAPYWDSNGDNFFSPIDIIQVINFLEEVNAEGEAQSAPETAMMVAPLAPQTPDSLASVHVARTDTQTAGVSPRVAVEPMPAANIARLETSTDERTELIESIDDHYWAEFWSDR